MAEKFNEEGIRVGDTEGLKEYYKELDSQAPRVNSEEFKNDLRDCTWQGPFVYDTAEKLDHYFFFSINENGNNSYYVLIEINLRNF